MSLICNDCGKEIETLPISINEFVCESCSTNRNILKLNKTIERLSLENEEFKEELTFFKKNVIQTKIPNSDFKFWTEFGNGVYLCDKGVKDNPSVTFICPQKTMILILEGKLEPFDEFFNGNLKIEGDLQYALVFFDIIKLASEINKETGGE